MPFANLQLSKIARQPILRTALAATVLFAASRELQLHKPALLAQRTTASQSLYANTALFRERAHSE